MAVLPVDNNHSSVHWCAFAPIVALQMLNFEAREGKTRRNTHRRDMRCSSVRGTVLVQVIERASGALAAAVRVGARGSSLESDEGVRMEAVSDTCSATEANALGAEVGTKPQASSLQSLPL